MTNADGLWGGDRPKFIVFEGIDGSGSSTQAAQLHHYLQGQGQKAVLSPEPSGGLLGKVIREALRQRIDFHQDPQRFNQQMAYLFASDRHDHLYNQIDGVFKLLADGFWVITTRYYFSSLAYNAHSEADFQFVAGLNQHFPNPDLVIYFDLPVAVSMARLSDRSFQEIYETQDYLTKVRANYEKIFANYQDPLLRLDATQPMDTIHQRIRSHLSL